MLTLPIQVGKKYVRRDGKVVVAQGVWHATSVLDNAKSQEEKLLAYQKEATRG